MYTQPAETVAPATCPFCNSRNVKTTSKELNAATYWRCTACEQIWNVSRLLPGWRRPPGRFK